MEDLISKAVSGEMPWSNLALVVLIVWLTQFFTWVIKQLWNKSVNHFKPNLHDFKVYQKYQSIFSQRVLDFIKTHTFANPYLRGILDPIDEAFYYDRFNSPELSFHDKKLEKKRTEMIEALNAFWQKLNHETFCLDSNMEYSNVPIRQNDPEQEKRDQIISEINDLASNLSSQLESFNKDCLKKFDQKISVTDNSQRQD